LKAQDSSDKLSIGSYSLFIRFSESAVDTENFFEESTEQSRIKAAIVRDYFWAWAKIILKKKRGQIAYVDLFAGPGSYKDGTKSTPLLVLEKAIADPEMRERLVTIFNDSAQENVRSLRAAIAALPGIEELKHPPDVDAGRWVMRLLGRSRRST
jgi:hypothetical protein